MWHVLVGLHAQSLHPRHAEFRVGAFSSRRLRLCGMCSRHAGRSSHAHGYGVSWVEDGRALVFFLNAWRTRLYLCGIEVTLPRCSREVYGRATHAMHTTE